jgi:hypothetical protein
MSLFWRERIKIKMQVRPLFDSRFRAAVVGHGSRCGDRFSLVETEMVTAP